MRLEVKPESVALAIVGQIANRSSSPRSALCLPLRLGPARTGTRPQTRLGLLIPQDVAELAFANEPPL